MSRVPGYCKSKGCERPAGRTGYCYSHDQVKRLDVREKNKPQRQVRSTLQNIPKKPIKRRSDKRANEEREYNARVKVWLVGKMCAVFPGYPASQVHHIKGRENGMLMDEDYWLGVSDLGHKFIHENPLYSQRRGFMVLRSVSTKKTI